MLLLRKKKFQEQLLSKTDGQLENLEHMVNDLEFAQVEIKVIDGLKIGNKALKQLHDILSIEDIEKVLDETREGIDKQRELDDLFSGTLTDEDEGEAEAELEAMLAEGEEKMTEKEGEKKLPDVPKDILLPDVPEDIPEKQKGSIGIFFFLLLLYFGLLFISFLESPGKEKTREAVPLEA